MSPLLSIILTAALSNFVIGGFVWFKAYKRNDGVAFGILGLVTGFWCLTNFFVVLDTQAGLVKFAYSLGSLVAVMGVIWMVEFGRQSHALGDKLLKTIKALAVFIGIPMSILALLDGLGIHAYTNTGSLLLIQGPLFAYYSGVIMLLIV